MEHRTISLPESGAGVLARDTHAECGICDGNLEVDDVKLHSPDV
jgi:hypothetical protein